MDNRYTQTEKSRNIYFERTIAKYKCKIQLKPYRFQYAEPQSTIESE